MSGCGWGHSNTSDFGEVMEVVVWSCEVGPEKEVL